MRRKIENAAVRRQQRQSSAQRAAPQQRLLQLRPPARRPAAAADDRDIAISNAGRGQPFRRRLRFHQIVECADDLGHKRDVRQRPIESPERSRLYYLSFAGAVLVTDFRCFLCFLCFFAAVAATVLTALPGMVLASAMTAPAINPASRSEPTIFFI